MAVLSRGQRSGALPPALELLHADRHDQAGLWEAVGRRTFDVVVDNIAFSGQDVVSLLDALDGRVEHLVLTSSTAVYADRYVRRPLREDDADLQVRRPVDAPDAFHPRLGHSYANGKREAEQALKAGDVPWTILRPPVVLGSDDRTLRVWWLVQRLLDGQPLLIPEWGAGRMFQVAWSGDIARASVAVAGNERAIGRAYNVAQAEVYTAESWLEAAAAVLEVKVTYARFPEQSTQALGLEGYALPIAGRPFGHVLLDLSAIRTDVGFEPSPEATWLGETIAGCAAQPPAQDSAGYARREVEVSVARRLLGTMAETSAN